WCILGLNIMKKFVLTDEHIYQLDDLIEEIYCGLHEDFSIYEDLEDEDGEIDEEQAEQRTQEFLNVAVKYLVATLNKRFKTIAQQAAATRIYNINQY
ncbi:MAG: hypothetical protein EBX50_15160, partial [Chitinophagia bacterium]|nr:hypothetical protein [Chitinophagia bacterium]